MRAGMRAGVRVDMRVDECADGRVHGILAVHLIYWMSELVRCARVVNPRAAGSAGAHACSYATCIIIARYL